MAHYPSTTFVPRTIENEAGTQYDASRKTIIYAEDIMSITDEIIAIEQSIGLSPQGSYASLAERITALEQSNPIYTQPSRFRANKNGTSQTIPSNTYTKLTMTNETEDVGNCYDATNSRLILGHAGQMIVFGHALISSGLVDRAGYWACLYKNGTLYSESAIRASGTNPITVKLGPSLITFDNDTDYYEFYIFCGGARNTTVDGATTHTEWAAVEIF